MKITLIDSNNKEKEFTISGKDTLKIYFYGKIVVTAIVFFIITVFSLIIFSGI